MQLLSRSRLRADGIYNQNGSDWNLVQKPNTTRRRVNSEMLPSHWVGFEPRSLDTKPRGDKSELETGPIRAKSRPQNHTKCNQVGLEDTDDRAVPKYRATYRTRPATHDQPAILYNNLIEITFKCVLENTPRKIQLARVIYRIDVAPPTITTTYFPYNKSPATRPVRPPIQNRHGNHATSTNAHFNELCHVCLSDSNIWSTIV